MHGGQAIPAFDFYLAPYVRMSYIEELKATAVSLMNDAAQQVTLRERLLTAI